MMSIESLIPPPPLHHHHHHHHHRLHSPLKSSSTHSIGGGRANRNSSMNLLPSRIDNLFQQPWHPCTAGQSIHNFLQHMEFPMSFRLLNQQWQDQNRPRLEKLQWPEGLAYTTPNNALYGLEVLTSMQEFIADTTIGTYLQAGNNLHPKPFHHIASHVHIYASVRAELEALYHGWGEEVQEDSYQTYWRHLFSSLERDRSFCQSLGSHECLLDVLWGGCR
jgi:hypothetical protein